MSIEKIIQSWEKKNFESIYLLHGEEDYYIDQIVHFAEHKILSESESSFNLSIFYGKDADWTTVISACKRYPMFAERQVVILKEAQMMRSLEFFESYIENPLKSTILIIAYKGKTVDKRLRVLKQIQKNGVIFESNKLKEYELNAWISNFIASKGLKTSSKCITLLAEHIGNELSRIDKEITKLRINLKDKNEIEEADIEKFVGISKEYNAFELQVAICQKNLSKAMQIINYFEDSPKENPIHKIIPALYSFFGKVHGAYGMNSTDSNSLKPLFYHNTSAVNNAQQTMKNYGFTGVEKIILLLNHYNLKSLGVGDSGTEGALLMKEMVVKMML
jgi:DNA polymerase-3 subunit delta